LKLDEAKHARTDAWQIMVYYVDSLDALGLQQAAYCQDCGCKYDG
jgi:hypothetical protein